VKPNSSKARRWTGVGVVISVKAGRSAADWMVLVQMVPRSARRLRRLCTGEPSAVTLVVILARAEGERRAGATGLGRAVRPTAGLSS
jgi:hypothetical protein